jgi:hypothetical protein
MCRQPVDARLRLTHCLQQSALQFRGTIGPRYRENGRRLSSSSTLSRKWRSWAGRGAHITGVRGQVPDTRHSDLRSGLCQGSMGQGGQTPLSGTKRTPEMTGGGSRSGVGGIRGGRAVSTWMRQLASELLSQHEIEEEPKPSGWQGRDGPRRSLPTGGIRAEQSGWHAPDFIASNGAGQRATSIDLAGVPRMRRRRRSVGFRAAYLGRWSRAARRRRRCERSS